MSVRRSDVKSSFPTSILMKINVGNYITTLVWSTANVVNCITKTDVFASIFVFLTIHHWFLHSEFQHQFL